MANGKKKNTDKIFRLKLNTIHRVCLDSLVEHYDFLTAAGVLRKPIKRDIKQLKLQSKV